MMTKPYKTLKSSFTPVFESRTWEISSIFLEWKFLIQRKAFPLEQNLKSTPTDVELLKDPSQYRRLVGHLIYLTITRPYITYSVHILSQFMRQPRKLHLEAAHSVLRYLKKSPGQGILFPTQSSLQLRGYCDADWDGCPTTRRSVTGFCIFLGDVPINWKSKKQISVPRSSAKAEYRSMASITYELVWSKYFLEDLQVKQEQLATWFCYNQADLHIAANLVFHERTKHIELDFHAVRERIQSGLIPTTHVPSAHQNAHIFTKPLGRALFHHHLRKLGALDIHAPT
ncbi:hypothetical protein L3X38_026251 [Prunus dulcis]|uniref:Retrovirus-related Pol polyprotein from transposon RE1 n=1 Tax=Prunus dulcis TaxID=3755 RepID=A0AAD4W537_PRUDU|nr:hypothetical protein L3X38_026251 [Prunus dulcis]